MEFDVNCTYLLLEIFAFFRYHGVGLRDDGDDIDFVTEPLHEFHVEGFQSVSTRRYKVETAVYARIERRRFTCHSGFSVQKLFIFGFDKIDYGFPTKNVILYF